MKRHVKSLLVATLCAVFTWACEQGSPTSPSALGTPGAVSLGAAGGVSIGPDGLPILTAKGGNKGGGGGGKGGGGKGSPPTATLTGAMESTGGFLLTFFKESDTNLEANSDGTSLVLEVTTDFTGAVCLSGPSYDLLGSELDDTQDIFAIGIGVNKTTGTGSVGLHYTDSSLGLITLTVTGPANYIGDDNDGNIESFTIGVGGEVLVQLREGKPKDRVTLVCDNLDTVTVNIAK